MIPHSKPCIGPDEAAAVAARLAGGLLAEGDMAVELRRLVCDTFGLASGVPCGSGTQAFFLALRAAGIGEGGRVAMPTYVCPSLVAVVLEMGGRPCLLDIDEDLLVSAEQARAAAEECDALIIPYVMGRWKDLGDLRGKRAVVIEDFAQFLATPETGWPGCRGDMAVFSFHATKMVCAGEGGFVAGVVPEFAAGLERAKKIGEFGHAFNMYPLNDMSACLGAVQLERLGEFVETRKRLAGRYMEMAEQLPGIEIPPCDRSIFFRFPVKLPEGTDVDETIEAFGRKGVAVRRPVDTLLHRHVAGPGDAHFPAAVEAYSRIVSLPLYPALLEVEQDKVMQAAVEVLGRLKAKGGSEHE